MTDSSPGTGWWLASDGNWYPPHLHPDATRREPDTAIGATTTTERAGTGAADAAHVASTGAVAAGTRTAESDADILAAFHITDDPARAATSPGVPDPATLRRLDDIRQTTGGGIDWEAVARERAAQREQRNRQASAARRRMYAVGGAVVALIAIALIARTDRGGDDSTRTRTTPTTSAASAPVSTTSPATTVPSTTAPATTLAPTPTASGATAAPATGATASTGASAGTAGGTVSVFSLAPGSCIDQDDLTTGLVTTVKSVACDKPHTHEVYFKTAVTPADQAYDAAKVTAFANQACTQGFEAYVGIPYEQSKYYFLHLAPSAESWNKDRDRDVICLLLLEGQKLTSSVKGKKE